MLALGLVFCTCFFCACSELAAFGAGALDGYDAGMNGYSLLGSASSSSQCSSMCAARNYSSYRYNPNTSLCYCK